MGMDKGRNYFSLIDCGSTRFAVWCQVREQNAASIIDHLEVIFCEGSSLTMMLANNDAIFCSKTFRDFIIEWEVCLRFCCAQVPSSKGIMEQCHWSVKRIAARKLSYIMEAVYWYNVIPKDNVSPLTANMIYHCQVWLKGIDALPPADPEGDHSWVRVSNRR